MASPIPSSKRAWVHAKIAAIPFSPLKSFCHLVYQAFCSLYARLTSKGTPLSERTVTPLTSDTRGISSTARSALTLSASDPPELTTLKQAYYDALNALETWSREQGCAFHIASETDVAPPTIDSVIGCTCSLCTEKFTRLHTATQRAATHVRNFEQLLRSQQQTAATVTNITQAFAAIEPQLAAIHAERTALTTRIGSILSDVTDKALTSQLTRDWRACQQETIAPELPKKINDAGDLLIADTALSLPRDQLLLAIEGYRLMHRHLEWRKWDKDNHDALAAYDTQRQPTIQNIQTWLTGRQQRLPPELQQNITITNNLQKLATAIDTLHSIEQKWLSSQPDALATYPTNAITFDTPTAQSLPSITPRQESLQERQQQDQRYLAYQWALCFLETNPQGQCLARLLKATSYTKSDGPLLRACYQVISQSCDQAQLTAFIQASYLQGTYATPWPILEWDWNAWRQKLIGIWIQQLPRSTRDHLLQDQDADAFQANAQIAFANWMYQKSGLTWNIPLTFPTDLVDNTTLQKEAQSAQRLNQWLHDKGRPAAVSEDISTPTAYEKGSPEQYLFSLSGQPLMSSSHPAPPPAPPTRTTATSLPPPSRATTSPPQLEDKPPTQLISSLPPFSPEATLLSLLDDRTFSELRQKGTHPPEGAFYYYFSLFQQYAESLQTSSSSRPSPLTSSTMRSQFAWLIEEFKLLDRGNGWRRAALRSYLQLIKAHLPESPWRVSHSDRQCLLQWARLAEYDDLPPLVYGVKRPDFSSLGDWVSETSIPYMGFTMLQLEQTSLKFEGLPEEVITETYRKPPTEPRQPPAVVDNPENRKRIDFLRARGEAELTETLFPDVEEACPLTHSEGQEAQARALLSILRTHPESHLVEERLAKLPAQTTYAIPPSFQIPDRIFYLDILSNRSLTTLPNWGTYHAPAHLEQYREAIDHFNQQLIDSQSAPQMLMGYARALTLATQRFLDHQTTENFCTLLKYKIAYQSLKNIYFSGSKLSGFLQKTADHAEYAMASSAIACATFCKNQHDAIYQGMRQLAQQGTGYAEEKLSQAFPEIACTVTPNGILLTIGAFTVDSVSGVVYFEGKKLSELPAPLRNHPHLRLLNLQKLSYKPTDAATPTFEHFSLDEENKPVVQVRICLNDKNLEIFKRILVDKKPRYVRYLPFEKTDHLPRALVDKGAQTFWIDEQGTTYGLTQAGSLAVYQTAQGTIYTPPAMEGFHIPAAYGEATHVPPLITYLSHLFPRDGLLVASNGSTVQIPALALAFHYDTQAKAWYSERTHLSGLYVDLAVTKPGVLVLKPPQGGRPDSPAPGSPQHQKSVPEQLEEYRLRMHALGSDHSLKANQERAALQKKISLLEREQHTLTERRIYLSVHLASQEYKEQKQLLKAQAEALLTLPQDSPEAQARYLQAETAYRTARDAFFSQPVYSTLYESLPHENVQGLDLASCAHLVALSAGGATYDPITWIQTLAQHPGGLDPKTRHFLEKAATAVADKEDDLTLYLHLLLLQDAFCRLDAARNRGEVTSALEPAYENQKALCNALLENPHLRLPQESTALRAKYIPRSDSALRNTPLPHAPMKPHVQQALRSDASRSWLERLKIADKVHATKKTSARLDPEQQQGMQDMQALCSDNMEGLRYEEFGSFSKTTFSKLFDDPAVADAVLQGLVKAGILTADRTDPTAILYTLDEKEGVPFLARTQQARVLALLSQLPMPLSQQQKTVIADKLGQFLFQTAQMGFSFKWPSEVAQSQALEALASARKAHLAAWLQAEDFLNQWLHRYNFPENQLPLPANQQLALTDLKRMLLTGSYTKAVDFASVRQALILYLFHKTEVQHIDNILKAPLQGARSQLLLCSTPRQYRIDDIYVPATTTEQREEQLIQLAFLLFEEDYGYRCDPRQVPLFRALMLSPTHAESVQAIQARMGVGKTTLAPLLALMQLAKEQDKPNPDQRALVCYVVPSTLLQANSMEFNARLAGILGLNVIQDREFPRYYIDPQQPINSVPNILSDIADRLRSYEHARKNGMVLIQNPEIRQSMEDQEAIFGKLEQLAPTPEEKQAWTKCRLALGRLRAITSYTVYDELDVTMASNSGGVNFTFSRTAEERVLMDPTLIAPLVQLIGAVQTYMKVPSHRGIPPAPAEFAKFLLSTFHLSDTFIDFVSNKARDADSLTGPPSERSLLLLIRALVLDPHLLAFITEKEPGVHFGVRCANGVYSDDPFSLSKLLLAVPYEGSRPKGRSLFENSEAAAIATYRYYQDPNTRLEEVHVDFLLTQERGRHIHPVLKEPLQQSNGGKAFLSELQRIATLEDETQIKQAKERFLIDFFQKPDPAVRDYLGRVIIARQVGVEPEKANSNRGVVGSLQDEFRGFSGTTDHTASLFAKTKTDPATDEKISVGVFCRQENKIATLSEATTSSSLPDVLKALLQYANTKTRAIIDVAGMCRGPSEDIVKVLWTLLPNSPVGQPISGIVYYDEENQKRLYRGPDAVPIPCTAEMEERAAQTGAYFSFYADRNTRGADIKQVDTAHALFTVDLNTSNSSAKQGALRLRNIIDLESPQTLTFILKESLERRLTARYGAELRPRHLAHYLMEQEQLTKAQEALFLFKEDLYDQLKLAAICIERELFIPRPDITEADQERIHPLFLAERDKIVSLLVTTPDTLADKYGNGIETKSRAQFLTTCKKLHKEKLQQLYELYGQTEKQLTKQEVAAESPAAPPAIRTFFDKRYQQSEALFCDRFPLEKMVEDRRIRASAQAHAEASLPTQSDRIAIAEGVRQTVATAATQSLTTTLSTTTTETETSLPYHPRLKMAEVPPFPLDDSWFQKPDGVTLEQYYKASLGTGYHEPTYTHLYALVATPFRPRLAISPHLQKNRFLLPRFALVPKDPSKPYIFISQEEANRWKQLKKTGKTAVAYSLYFFDRRDDRVTDPCLQQMQYALLQRVPSFDVNALTDTQTIRTLSPESKASLNVDSADFLPSWHLQVKPSCYDPNKPANYKPPVYLDLDKLRTYGISGFTGLSCEWRISGDTWVLSAPPGWSLRRCAIPLNNPLLQEWLTTAYQKGQEGLSTLSASITGDLSRRLTEYQKASEDDKKQAAARDSLYYATIESWDNSLAPNILQLRKALNIATKPGGNRNGAIAAARALKTAIEAYISPEALAWQRGYGTALIACCTPDMPFDQEYQKQPSSYTLQTLQHNLRTLNNSLEQFLAYAYLTDEKWAAANSLPNPQYLQQATNTLGDMDSLHAEWFGSEATAPGFGVRLPPGAFWASLNLIQFMKDYASGVINKNYMLTVTSIPKKPSQVASAVAQYRQRMPAFTEQEAKVLAYYETLSQKIAQLAGTIEDRTPEYTKTIL